MTERICTKTGLHLVEAGGERRYRVAKDRHGALSARRNEHVGPMPVGFDSDAGDSRGRYDTLGSTIYLAESRRCAYAEVLNEFRQVRARIAQTATSIGRDVDKYIESVIAEAEANGVCVPWTISVDWQMDRSIYEDPLAPAGLVGSYRSRGHPQSPGRPCFDNGRAHVIRRQTLDDGSEPLGIVFQSRTLTGDCWAYWDRRADEGLPPGSNDLMQMASENVGPDPVFATTAEFYRLPVMGPR